jgi:hypothetical protein
MKHLKNKRRESAKDAVMFLEMFDSGSITSDAYRKSRYSVNIRNFGCCQNSGNSCYSCNHSSK